MKFSFASSLQRRLAWLNLPTAVLITLLQRSPVVRLATAVEEMVTASPVGTILKTAASAVAALGAMNTLAGATPLVPSAGTASGITVTVGTSVSVGYTANSPLGPAVSWSITGARPAGLDFTNLSSSSILLSGTPTAPGVFPITISAFGPNMGEQADYAYTITVVAGGGGGGNTIPAFTTQPVASQSVSVGANVTFTVAVSGTPTPTIQWKKGSTDVAGATGLTLTLNNVQTSDSGTYTAVATNTAGSTTSSASVLTVSAATSAPSFTTQPTANQSVGVGANVTLTVAVSGNPTPTIQWKKGGTDIAGATSTTLQLNNVQLADSATYTAVATNSVGSVTSNGAVVSVVNSSAPAVTVQPVGHTVAAGRSVVFSAEVTGGGLTYQWKKGALTIAGATSSQLLLSNVQPGDAGSYTVTATNGSGSVTSNGATLAVAGAGDPGRLINASVRIVSGTDANVLIVGFVTGGAGTSGNKQLMIRGIGPTLAGFGVPGTMVDPLLQVIPQGSVTPIDSNDNWGGNAAVSTTAAAVGAFALPDPTSKDAAFVTTLAAGVYSAKVSGVNNTSGTVLAELYDAAPSVYNPATPRLINMSARVPMANDNPLIAGFVVGGSTATTVMIRAVGPFLSQFFGAAAMSDPKLELYIRQAGVDSLMLSNDNWGGSALISNTANALGAFALADGASKDAVLLVTLDPGVYSAKVLGVNNASGITLVEIYEIP